MLFRLGHSYVAQALAGAPTIPERAPPSDPYFLSLISLDYTDIIGITSDDGLMTVVLLDARRMMC